MEAMGLTWTCSRSSLSGQMVNPLFRPSCKKWLLGSEDDKMIMIGVNEGRLLMHLKETSFLSKQWGPSHV
jgi:hypothetical protein